MWGHRAGGVGLGSAAEHPATGLCVSRDIYKKEMMGSTHERKREE
jgi:hypothetical protein